MKDEQKEIEIKRKLTLLDWIIEMNEQNKKQTEDTNKENK